MSDKRICLDANIWIKLFTPEEGSDTVKDLIRLWIEEGVLFIGPSFLLFEFSSALRKKEKRNLLKENEGSASLEFFYSYPILLYQSEEYLKETWDLAKKMEETVLYDVGYLALALWQKVPFYTADEKFFNKAKKIYPEIHLIQT